MQDYGMFEGDPFNSGDSFYSEDLKNNAKGERREIRLLGSVVGAILLVSMLIENASVWLLVAAKIYTAYRDNAFLRTGIDIIITLVSFLPPFVLGAKFLKSISGTKTNLLLEKPVDNLQFILAIPAGLGFCMIANRVTTFFIMVVSMLGFELSSPDIPMPGGALGVTASFFRVVAVAAIVEELCFRGFVMQNLRKFGDWFAVVVSSLVFALMHGNLVQAPFALIAGITLGYMSVKTNTLWTGIIIHGLNNLISLFVSYLVDYTDETTASLIYLSLMSAIIFVGLLCFLLFFKRQRDFERGMLPTVSYNGFAAKTATFFFNPPMLGVFAMLAYFASSYVKRAG